MRALHICSQLSKSRTNKNHFKLVSCLSSCGKKKKKKKRNSAQEIPLGCQNRQNHQNHKLVTKFLGLPEKVEPKREKYGSHRRDRSQKSPDKHMHTHIKPIWTSKWNHMWEELSYLCFPINSTLTCSGIFKYTFCASFPLAEVATCAEDCFYFVAGKFLEQLPAKRQMGKKICMITAARSNRISLLA